MAYAAVSKTVAERHVGSTPIFGTKYAVAAWMNTLGIWVNSAVSLLP